MANPDMATLTQIIATQVQQNGDTIQQFQNHITSLHAQVTTLTQQVAQLTAANHETQTAGETAYRTLHAQLQATQDRITTEMTSGGGNPRGGGGGKWTLVDPKQLLPDTFGGAKNQAWRDWAFRLKAYVQAKSPTLRLALEQAERFTSTITHEFLAHYGVSAEEDYHVSSCTGDHAHPASGTAHRS